LPDNATVSCYSSSPSPAALLTYQPQARRSLDIQREFEDKKAREAAAMQNGADDDDEEEDDEEDA
jgi:hypothetical protein